MAVPSKLRAASSATVGPAWLVRNPTPALRTDLAACAEPSIGEKAASP